MEAFLLLSVADPVSGGSSPDLRQGLALFAVVTLVLLVLFVGVLLAVMRRRAAQRRARMPDQPVEPSAWQEAGRRARP